MAALFEGLSGTDLRTLAAAFRVGRLGPGASRLAIKHMCPCPESVVAEVLRLLAEGIAPAHLALLLEGRAEVVDGGLVSDRHAELVWTGPEGQAAFSRDTSVVVRELFETAQRSVLVSTFVVRQGAKVFEALARRMDERSDLEVDLFLHVGRGLRDTRYESEILRECAAGFKKDWPGSRLPRVYYDPRALAANQADRATWHAKCVVVDGSVAFVTSANFTEWAQQRNVEAGVLVREPEFVKQLLRQFKGLVEGRLVALVPGL